METEEKHDGPSPDPHALAVALIRAHVGLETRKEEARKVAALKKEQAADVAAAKDRVAAAQAGGLFEVEGLGVYSVHCTAGGNVIVKSEDLVRTVK